ncbi:uncharacterized protein UTRI_04499_B [Ustilago trichophora]|uniref:Uncharacterized protein n=1 Tax=Ustilago trichophora TaxID=86804 RepID=A0A5C3ECG0_9BASI|nr:uncharacterized protein UTRI_04499_B [Ustilago trichophora]
MTRTPMSRIEELEQTCLKINKDLLDVHSDFRRRVEQLEKQIGGIDRSQDDLKRDLRTLEQRVDVMLNGSIQTDSRLSKAQTHLEEKVSRLFEQQDTKIDTSSDQIKERADRLFEQQEAKIDNLRDNILLPFFEAFQNIATSSRSPQQDVSSNTRLQSESISIQASADAAVEALKHIFRGVSTPQTNDATTKSSAHSARENFEPRQDIPQAEGWDENRDIGPHAINASTSKRLRSPSIENSQSERPLQHARVCRSEPREPCQVAGDIHNRSLGETGQIQGQSTQQPTTAQVGTPAHHSAVTSGHVMGRTGPERPKENLFSRTSEVSRDEISLTIEPASRSLREDALEPDREVVPSKLSETREQNASMISRISDVQGSLRGVLEETHPNLRAKPTAEYGHDSNDAWRERDSTRVSKQSVEADDVAIRRQSRLKALKELRAYPSQASPDDSFFLFARLGKWKGSTPLVITENKNIKYSLISEVLANALVRQGETGRASEDSDPWITLDLFWPYDAGKQLRRSNGTIAGFDARQVRFLVVPKADMTHGIVLAKKTFESLGLEIRYASSSRRHYISRDGNINAGALLDAFPQGELRDKLSQPFARLCRLAEYAATRKNPKKSSECFFRQTNEFDDDRRRDELDARRTHDIYRSDRAM